MHLHCYYFCGEIVLCSGFPVQYKGSFNTWEKTSENLFVAPYLSAFISSIYAKMPLAIHAHMSG